MISVAIALLALLGAAGQEDLSGFVGSYSGSVYSGGDFVDMVTVLRLNNAGELFGSYDFEDGEARTKGTLSQAMVLAGRLLSLTWTDRYGRGALVILFSADLSSFVGYFGDSLESANDLWTGLREEP